MTEQSIDGWLDFETTVRIKAPGHVRNGETVRYVEYECTGSARGIDDVEVDDLGVWIDGWDVTEHLRPEVVDDIYDVLYEMAAREEL